MDNNQEAAPNKKVMRFEPKGFLGKGALYSSYLLAVGALAAAVLAVTRAFVNLNQDIIEIAAFSLGIISMLAFVFAGLYFLFQLLDHLPLVSETLKKSEFKGLREALIILVAVFIAFSVIASLMGDFV